MSITTAAVIADEIHRNKWNSRIEFAMHGEPSLNDSMMDILEVFRTKLPRQHLMMTSNGAGFFQDPTDKIDEAMEYLNILALDDYAHAKLVPRIKLRYKGIHKLRDYPKDKDANPHRRRTDGKKLVSIVQDIGEATNGTHATLNNHAGCGSPPNDSGEGKRCAKPFRELSFRWDGSVAVCCNDWRGICKVGNIHTHTIQEIWNGPVMWAARVKLYEGQRDFGPCAGCDATSYRPGLLPDQRGKLDMPPVTQQVEQILEGACDGDPLTAPNRRPWEHVALKQPGVPTP